MSWIVISPHYEQEGVTHVPPRTACESTDVAEGLRACWERLAAEIPDCVLSRTRAKPGKAWLDFGGMRRMDWTVYKIDLGDDLILSVPARDVSGYITLMERMLAKKEPENIGTSARYRTLPSMHLNVFLSEPRFEVLLKRLLDLLPEARAIELVENAFDNEVIVNSPVPMAMPPRRTGPMEDA